MIKNIEKAAGILRRLFQWNKIGCRKRIKVFVKTGLFEKTDDVG